MSDAEYKILAAILPDRTARMETAQLRLLSAYNFATPALRDLWTIMNSYYDEHREIIPQWVLKETALQKGIEPTKVVTYVELHKRLSEITVMEHEFISAIQLLKEDELTRRTAEAIVTAREILQGEYYDDKTEETPRGQEAARDYLNETLQSLDVQSTESAPEGDMKDDTEKLWEGYLHKESSPEKAGGIKYGILELDEYTGGVHNGELVILAGFTGAGKSHLSVSLAWNAMLAGKNVLMFTTETTREEMEIRILARHSRLDEFRKPGGIDSHDIMAGTLSPDDRDVFREVLTDFRGRSGHLFMVQMPSDGSANYVKMKAEQYNRRAQVDLIIIDSINLLRAGVKYNSKREMLEDLLQDFKRFASAFDNGRGVPVVSPWQMSRTAWKEAVEAGGVYTMASLSDTAEAERCQPLWSKVLTSDGFVNMGDLHKGDQIIGSDGQPQQVVEVHENGPREIYLIELNDGTTVECTAGHIWTYFDEGTDDFMDATTEELRQKGGEFELPELIANPDMSTSTFPKNLPHPYILGRMLASQVQIQGQIHITSKHPELITQMLFVRPDYAIRGENEVGEVTFAFKEDGNLLDYSGMPVLVAAGLLSGSANRYVIPDTYLNARSQYREALLRGLLDIPFNPIKPADVIGCPTLLKHDLKFLADSLGIFTVMEGPRKIVNITPTGVESETRCITVSNSDGLYVTDGFALTHNSASQIVTVFVSDEGHLYLQVLKNRGGKEMPRVAYPYDYRNSYIGGGSNESGPAQSRKQVESRRTIVSSLDDMM